MIHVQSSLLLSKHGITFETGIINCVFFFQTNIELIIKFC